MTKKTLKNLIIFTSHLFLYFFCGHSLDLLESLFSSLLTLDDSVNNMRNSMNGIIFLFLVKCAKFLFLFLMDSKSKTHKIQYHKSVNKRISSYNTNTNTSYFNFDSANRIKKSLIYS